jgi:hypothetical protein
MKSTLMRGLLVISTVPLSGRSCVDWGLVGSMTPPILNFLFYILLLKKNVIMVIFKVFLFKKINLK